MAWMGVRRASLQWEFKSQPIVYRATVGDTGVCISERTCCGNCGCNILLQYYLYPDKSHVAASTVKQNDFEMPGVGCHIWYRHVPSWHNVPEDGVERYHEFDDDFKAKLDQYMSSGKI